MHLFTDVLKAHFFTFSKKFQIDVTEGNTESISRALYKFRIKHAND